MNNEKNITRGGLSGKMDGFRPEPPESVWEGVAAGLHDRRSGRRLLILLGTAAGIALALTVGITLLTDPVPQGIATVEETSNDPSAAASATDPSKNAGPPDPSTAAPTNNPSIPAGTSDPSNAEAITGIQTADAAAAGRSEAFADGRQRDTRAGDIETAVPRPENVSRLEHKVITAMQDVMKEQPAGNDKIAGTTELNRPVNDRTEAISMEANALAGNEDVESAEGQDIPAGDEQIQHGNDADRRVVNEDSLVRLLKEDTGPTGEDERLTPADRRAGKWQLGAALSPLISYRDVAAADASQNVAVNQSESARLTYAGGVGVSYLPSDRFTIQTGIYYNKMGVNIGEYSSFKSGWFESQLDMVSAPGRSESVVSISNSMGTVISGDEERFVNNYSGTGTLTDYHMLRPEEMIVADASVESFSQTFEYLEIPFNVRYKILDRTIDLQIMGGVSTNFLVNNSVAAIAGDQTVAIGKVEDVRMFNYSGNAGLGIVYDIFENFSFSVEPRFRYYLNSINTSELPVTRPYSFGFYTGVNYKF